MDFEAMYQSKLTAATEAAKVVKSGDWVDYGWCNGTTDGLPIPLSPLTGNWQRE